MQGRHGARFPQREKELRKRNERKRKGLCVRCGKNKVNEKFTCDICIEKNKEWQKLRKKRNLESINSSKKSV